MNPDLSFLFTLLRASLGAVFLLLGTVTAIMWRAQLLKPRDPANPQPQWVLPLLAWLFNTTALMFLLRIGA